MTNADYDIIVRRARLRGKGDELNDIAVAGGRIAAVAPTVQGAAAEEINAEGGLVTESFVNTHLHLCKVWTLSRMDELALRDYHGEGMGKAMTAIERAREVKRGLDRDTMIGQARRAAALAALHGNLQIGRASCRERR